MHRQLTLEEFLRMNNEQAREKIGFMLEVLTGREPIVFRCWPIPARQVLVSGPMGAWKSTLCECVAKEAGVDFLYKHVSSISRDAAVFSTVRATPKALMFVVDGVEELEARANRRIRAELLKLVHVTNPRVIIALIAPRWRALDETLRARFSFEVRVNRFSDEQLRYCFSSRADLPPPFSKTV